MQLLWSWQWQQMSRRHILSVAFLLLNWIKCLEDRYLVHRCAEQHLMGYVSSFDFILSTCHRRQSLKIANKQEFFPTQISHRYFRHKTRGVNMQRDWREHKQKLWQHEYYMELPLVSLYGVVQRLFTTWWNIMPGYGSSGWTEVGFEVSIRSCYAASSSSFWPRSRIAVHCLYPSKARIFCLIIAILRLVGGTLKKNLDRKAYTCFTPDENSPSVLGWNVKYEGYNSLGSSPFCCCSDSAWGKAN